MKFFKVGYREKIWDYVAGVIFVEEAGGRVFDVGGASFNFVGGCYIEGLDCGIIVVFSVFYECFFDVVVKFWLFL